MWAKRPVVAQRYLREVVHDFEQYAKRVYLPALTAARPKDENLYAGLRYAATRKIPGLDSTLYEQFTIRRRGKMAAKIDQACFDAMMETVSDRQRLARFFVELSKAQWSRSKSDLAAEGIRRIGQTAFETAFEALQTCDDGEARFRIAHLIGQASGTRTPRGLSFWKNADAPKRQAVIDEWRKLLVQRGLLQPDPSPIPDQSRGRQPADTVD